MTEDNFRLMSERLGALLLEPVIEHARERYAAGGRNGFSFGALGLSYQFWRGQESLSERPTEVVKDVQDGDRRWRLVQYEAESEPDTWSVLGEIVYEEDLPRKEVPDIRGSTRFEVYRYIPEDEVYDVEEKIRGIKGLCADWLTLKFNSTPYDALRRRNEQLEERLRG